MSEGTDNGNGTWTVQTNDIAALSITSPVSYTGALVLNVAESWTNADGSTGSAIVSDNVEVFAKGAPIFAWSGDDTLTGAGAKDLFVFAQPIGNDTVHNFNASEDQIDLIGFAGFASFDDVKNHLTADATGNAVITLGRRPVDHALRGSRGYARCRQFYVQSYAGHGQRRDDDHR